MSTTQIHSLIEKSSEFYISRSIPQAIEVAQKVLTLSGEAKDVEGMIRANLLLGQYHNTAAKYQGDKTIHGKALAYLQTAQELNDASAKNGQTMDILLALGDTYQYQENYSKAEKYYAQALAYSKEKKDLRGQILTLCGECQMMIQQNNFDKASVLAETCLQQIKGSQEEDEVLLAEAYLQLTQICLRKQDYVSLLEYCEPLLEISRKKQDLEKELHALNNLAIYYGVLADYKKAMQYFLEALDKSKSINYRNITAQCLINIGTIYAHFFNYKEALARYQTVLNDYGDVIETSNQAIVINNVGNIYFGIDNYPEAKAAFAEALDLAKKIQYKEMIALSMAQLSRTNTAMNQIEEALVMANEAQKIISDMGDVNGRQINLLNLGNINFQKKDFEKAIILTSQGIAAAKRMKDEANEIRGYQSLARIYKELKDFEKALDYQLVYSKSQEKFAKEQLNRQVMDLEIKYAIQEKQKEIEQLTKENQYQGLLLEQKDQIVKQNAQLLQANEELRQFAYVASHDLKEPLRMIGSYTQLIYRKHKNVFDEDSTSYYAFVSEGVNRMNNLLDALLRYATIGKTDEEFEEVRLNDAIELAVINLRVRIEETKAVVHIPQLPVVRSIKSLLIQLFQNLISNALKFKKPETQSIVHISTEEREDEIIVAVKDNGIGIAPEYQKRIFVIFQRLHSRAKFEGTGIGLSICLKIVQRLRGRIWIESEVDKGATFFVALPKMPADTNIN